MQIHVPLHCDSSTATRRRPRVRKQPQIEVAGGRSLRCRLCGAVITGEDERVPVQGAHVHTQRNPAGVVYCFGCFQSAPGCAVFGTPTGEHTWFAGCLWRIAACRGCGEHLGWRFQGAEEFYGLILDRLVTSKE